MCNFFRKIMDLDMGRWKQKSSRNSDPLWGKKKFSFFFLSIPLFFSFFVLSLLLPSFLPPSLPLSASLLHLLNYVSTSSEKYFSEYKVFVFVFFLRVPFIVPLWSNSSNIHNIPPHNSTSPFHILLFHFNPFPSTNSPLKYCLICLCYRKNGTGTLTHTKVLVTRADLISANPFQGI